MERFRIVKHETSSNFRYPHINCKIEFYVDGVRPPIAECELIYSVNNEEGELRFLCVRDGYRKQGYGKKMLYMALVDTIKHNIKKMNVYVHPCQSPYMSFDELIHFYEKFGFILTAVHGENSDWIEMYKCFK